MLSGKPDYGLKLKVAKLGHKLPALYWNRRFTAVFRTNPLLDPIWPTGALPTSSGSVSVESSRFTAVIRGDYSLLDPTKITLALPNFSGPVSSRSMSTLSSQVRLELQRSLPFWNSDYYSKCIPDLPEASAILPSLSWRRANLVSSWVWNFFQLFITSLS